MITKLKFLNRISEINLIVVSEKIIVIKPIKKVKVLIFKQLTFSFEFIINIKGIKVSKGIYRGITALL